MRVAPFKCLVLKRGPPQQRIEKVRSDAPLPPPSARSLPVLGRGEAGNTSLKWRQTHHGDFCVTPSQSWGATIGPRVASPAPPNCEKNARRLLPFRATITLGDRIRPPRRTCGQTNWMRCYSHRIHRSPAYNQIAASARHSHRLIRLALFSRRLRGFATRRPLRSPRRVWRSTRPLPPALPFPWYFTAPWTPLGSQSPLNLWRPAPAEPAAADRVATRSGFPAAFACSS